MLKNKTLKYQPHIKLYFIIKSQDKKTQTLTSLKLI